MARQYVRAQKCSEAMFCHTPPYLYQDDLKCYDILHKRMNFEPSSMCFVRNNEIIECGKKSRIQRFEDQCKSTQV